MSRVGRIRAESNYYHVVLRGNNRQVIFEDDEDRETFLVILRSSLVKSHTALLAWCLMDNHIHLLVYDANTNLSSFVQSVSSGYAVYFNQKHEHVGHVFQGRFFSAPIESERYLLETVRYIHHNPAKAGIAPHEQYRWSSYHEYCGRARIIDPTPLLSMLNDTAEFVRMHQRQANTLPLEKRGETFISDAEVLETANELLARTGFEIDAASIASLSRQMRDWALRTLLSSGLSTKRIERITGISSRTIQRARGVAKGSDPFAT